LIDSVRCTYPGTSPSVWGNESASPLISYLGPFGDSLEAAVAALQNPDYEIRWRAAGILGGVADPAALKALASAMGDPMINVRERVAAALWVSKDPKGNALLEESLLEPRWDLLWTAREWLRTVSDVRIPDMLLAALKDPNENTRMRAAYLLGVLKEPRAIEPLIVALGDKGEMVKFASAHALGAIKDPRAIEPLMTALGEAIKGGKANTELLRWAAVNTLGAMGDVKAVPVLMAALKDSDNSVATAASRALARLNDASAVESLIENFLFVLHAPFRAIDQYRRAASAARALGVLKDPRCLDALIGALKDSAYEVRWEALRAMGSFNDPKMIEPLIAVVKDKPSSLSGGPERSEAARVLSKFEDPRVDACLMAAASDQWVVAGAYRFFIAHGIERSALVEALRLRGDRSMIQDYADCGEPVLEDYAGHSAEDNFKWKPVKNPEQASVRWGQAGQK
jgi:HEAT repeat protein